MIEWVWVRENLYTTSPNIHVLWERAVRNHHHRHHHKTNKTATMMKEMVGGLGCKEKERLQCVYWTIWASGIINTVASVRENNTAQHNYNKHESSASLRHSSLSYTRTHRAQSMSTVSFVYLLKHNTHSQKVPLAQFWFGFWVYISFNFAIIRNNSFQKHVSSIHLLIIWMSLSLSLLFAPAHLPCRCVTEPKNFSSKVVIPSTFLLFDFEIYVCTGPCVQHLG